MKYKELPGTLWLSAPYTSSFLWIISTTVMSTDVSQVGVTLFPSFKFFLSIHLSMFSFYINCVYHLNCIIGLRGKNDVD